MAGKDSGCQNKWQKWTKSVSVKMLMEPGGLLHPRLGDSAVWNFVHKTASTDFYLQAAKLLSVLLIKSAAGRRAIASP